MGRAQGDRLRLLVFVVLAGSLVLWTRAAYLQIIRHDELHQKARNQQSELIRLRSLRGPILDRAGEPLAYSVEGSSLAVDPKFLLHPDSLALAFEKRGLLPASQVLDLLDRAGPTKRFVWLLRGKIHEADADALEERFSPALIRLPEPKRLYPLGAAAGPLIGSTGVDGQGLLGLEARYERDLHGIDGKMLDFRSGRREKHDGPGRVVLAAPQIGATAELTIDSRFQQIVDARLREAVVEQNAKGGCALLIDPKTGEILAIASMPAYDPDQVGEADSLSWHIWAIGKNYEPGSTYKAVTFAAAIEAGVLSPQDWIDCHNGKRKVPGGIISDHEPYGTIHAWEVLAHSSNIGTGIVAERIGAEAFYLTERHFGFGVPCGIEISGEERGRIPEPGSWSARSLVTQAFGQEISCTALQLAMAYGAIANGGLLMKPYLVRAVRTQTGELREQHEPEIVRQVLSPRTASTMCELLRSVVTEGTGKNAEVKGLFPAGKTGTAQKYVPEEGTYSNERYIASFAGFAPYDAPRWLCLVVIDEPRSSIWGGSVAAPVFAKILEDVAKLDTRPTEDPHAQIRMLAQGNDEGATTVPRLAGLTPGLARKLLKEAGLLPRLVGRGERVSEVLPEPGSQCRPGQVVTLVLSETPDSSGVGSGIPDFTGLSLRDAYARARWNGLSVDARGSGWVVRQSPEPGFARETKHLILWLASDSCRALSSTRTESP
jgi:cell division protein FtsI (penicillin-binding protein 3)